MGLPIIFSQTLAAASATNIAASQSPGAGAITLNGSAATGGVATLDTQRRVIVTSGGNDTGITFTVSGTNQSGAPISETIAGASGVAQTNLDFKTVTSVTHTGSVASTVTVGTNGVGSSPWQIVNWNTDPNNIGFQVELRSGAANFSVQYTLDDPNNLLTGLGYPLPINHPTVASQTATIDATFSTPIIAMRLLTNSGTGTLWCRLLQAGISSP